MLKKITLAAALAAAPIVLSQSAIAQDEAPKTDQEDAVEKELAFFDLFASAFGQENAEPIPEKKLDLARQTTLKILPEGSYGRMMDKTFGQMLAPLGAIFAEISPLEIASTTGVDETTIYDLSAENRDQIANIIDPHRAKRGQKTLDVMLPIMKEVSTAIEPALREGMAKAYARKFSNEQLTELNTFFNTPTGNFYASESFVLMADPEVMQASMQAMPIMMEKMLEIIPTLGDNMDKAHEPRTLADLNDTELEKLAELMSIDTQDLKDYRDNPPADEGISEEAEEGHHHHHD